MRQRPRGVEEEVLEDEREQEEDGQLAEDEALRERRLQREQVVPPTAGLHFFWALMASSIVI